MKEKKTKKGKLIKAADKDEDLVDFEDCSSYDTVTSFYHMNLSRPLLKVSIKRLIKTEN